MKKPLQRALRTGCIVGFIAASGCETQRRFATPEDAIEALVAATESRDKQDIRSLFGSKTAALRSGDADQDEKDLAVFSRKLHEARVIERRPDGQAVILIGRDQWPFAVPLVEDDKGWRFDTEAGIEELTNRRIGRNELCTIEACRTLIQAQTAYHSVDRDGDGVLEYAMRLMSTSGNKDGLYWPSPGGVDPSPIGPSLALAATRRDAFGNRIPYYGYVYRLLTRGVGADGNEFSYVTDAGMTEGWLVVAWPAEYAQTGVMSFLVGHEGVVYESDLGPDTESLLADVEAIDPSLGWQPISESP